MVMKENQTGGGKTHAPRRVGRDEKLIQNPGVSVEGETYTIMTAEQYDAMLARNKGAETVDEKGNAIGKGKKEGIPGLHGLLNALENGKGHKYGIYKRLGIVNAPGGGNGNNGGGKDHPGNAQGRIPHEHPTYYYHGDHLGSSSMITDDEGELYQHLEYFPYGEGWVDEHQNRTNLPFKFTGKELDPETGLYYYGARYYDPRVSMWISTDQALEGYMPASARSDISGLPGYGGAYNHINLNVYGYAGTNPVKLSDPDGNALFVGALIGAAIDIGVQGVLMAAGVQDEFSFSSVAISAAAGATGVGLVSVASKISKVKKLGTVAKAAVELTSDMALSAGESAVRGEDVTVGGAFVDAVVGQASGQAGNKIAKKLKGGSFPTTSSGKPSTLVPGPHASKSVPAEGPSRKFTSDTRKQINDIGVCHTCGTTDPGTKSGNFVPDHQPPNKLNIEGGSQELFPHCINCSRQQGGEVNKAVTN